MILVLDTSTLIHDPSVIDECYPGDDIVIPLIVINELDKLKENPSHPGPAAREVFRRLDAIREDPDSITRNQDDNGVIDYRMKRPVGGTIRVEMNHYTDTNLLPPNTVISTADDRIMLVALNLMSEGDGDLELLSQDRSMLLIGEVWGINTRRHTRVEADDSLSEGVETYETKSDEITQLYENGSVFLDVDYPVNTGVIFNSNGSAGGLGLMDRDGHVVPMKDYSVCGISPRNARQKTALNLMMGNHAGRNNTEFLGAISGRAGSGKTLLSIATGLYRVLQGDYKRVVIFRPTDPVGRDLGYLPGSLDEKMLPWTAVINDILDVINPSGGKTMKNARQESFNVDDILSVDSINYIRGRTLTDTFVIIDESQNLEVTEIRTVLSRLGRNSAAVLNFDPSQIDNAYLKSGRAEGVEAVLQKVLPDPMAWHVQFTSPERGGVSALID